MSVRDAALLAKGRQEGRHGCGDMPTHMTLSGFLLEKEPIEVNSEFVICPAHTFQKEGE